MKALDFLKAFAIDNGFESWEDLSYQSDDIMFYLEQALIAYARHEYYEIVFENNKIRKQNEDTTRRKTD